MLIFSFTITSYYGAAVNVGYREHSLILASPVMNCQCTPAADVLRSVSYAANSICSIVRLLIHLDRHCLVNTLTSIYAVAICRVLAYSVFLVF